MFHEKKIFFFTKIVFSYNIAQALHNAGLVINIDHWVMENDPSQVGRISENPGLAGSFRYEILDMQGKMSKMMENHDINKIMCHTFRIVVFIESLNLRVYMDII